MNFGIAGKVEGYYHDITVVRNAGKKNQYIDKYCVKVPSKNLLTDGFFTRWLSGSLLNGSWRFFVGTGTTAPANSDTQLESILGSASDSAAVTINANVFEDPDYIASSTGVAQWAVGAIVGNISEIGANIRTSTATNALDSRALIVDGGGSPTTISVTADDQLIVSYTLRYRIPISQHVSVVDFGEGDTTCTLETVGALAADQWGFGVIFDPGYPFRPSTNMQISSTANLQNDVDGQFNFGTTAAVGISGSSTGTARRVTLTASASQFNQVGNIKYMLIMSAGNLARQGILFNPPIAKTNLKTLVLHFDYTLARA